MSLIGKKIPQVKASAVVNGAIVHDFSIQKYEGKYVLLFFYPLDFTFVCPTELHAFQQKYDQFKSLGAEVIACSRDSAYSHIAWLATEKNHGGIKGVSYPLIADMKLDFIRSYDVLKEEDAIAYRGLFIIDRQGVIRHQLVNDTPIGRSVDEAIRVLQALQHFEKNGEVCPANWHEGDKAFKTNKKELDAYCSEKC